MTKEELKRLIGLYLSGQASAGEEKLIDDFFEAQEKKQALPHYRLSEEMWASIEKKISTQPDTSISKWKKDSRTNKRLPSLKILVPVVVCILLITGFLLQRSLFSDAEKRWVTAEMPKGQKSLIVLADGSRVFLNSASSISYPEVFDSRQRELVLQGEAFFEIARDENRPFIVRSGNVLTTVLGTSFDIEAFEGEPTRVSVATGKVQVEVSGKSGIDNTHRVIVTSNQQAVYEPQTGLVTGEADPDQFLAWKNQTLYFDNSTLEEVALHLERWYNASIEFENQQIRNCRINGQYKEMDLQSVLESIQYMYPIEYKIQNQNHVVLYGQGCDE